MDIFELSGPEFLKFYFAAFAGAMLLSFILPHVLRFPFDLPYQAGRDLGPFDIAGLKGGKKAALNAAFATLWHRGLLALNSTAGRFSRTAKAEPADLHPLEKDVLKALGRVGEPRDIARRSIAEYNRLQSRLVDQGLMLSPFNREVLRLARILPPLILLVVGIAKIGVGITRGRPVAFLILASILTSVALIFWFLHMPRRTWRGDRVLKALAFEHSALQFASRRLREQAAPADAAMSVALFGVGAMVFGSDLVNVLEPPRPMSTTGAHAGSGGSSTGSSCSSSSNDTSSGSSCGGGGGGSGCGGCGGGGGGD